MGVQTMEEVRYRARLDFQSVYKDLTAKTRDEAERQAQDFCMEYKNVDLVDVEIVHKDKDSCKEHFDIGCQECKKVLNNNVENGGLRASSHSKLNKSLIKDSALRFYEKNAK